MMPAYNFKRQFVPKILDGSKIHTIRRRRKNPTKDGDILYLYTGMRTKQCELIMQTKCSAILPIEVVRGYGVTLDGNLLSDEDTIKLALADGFEDVFKFFDFFDQYPYEVVSKELEIIYWRPK